jgi:hypothetical protein
VLTLVLEVLLLEKHLLARTEDELLSALNTGQGSISEFHLGSLVKASDGQFW